MKNQVKYTHGGNVFTNKETKVKYSVEQRPDGIWTIYSEGPQWSRRDEYEYGFASESDAIDIAKIEAGITNEEDPEGYFFRKTEWSTGGGLKSNQYEVELESIDNPDFEYKKRYTKKIKKHRVSVSSIEEAKKVVGEFINDNDLGAGNFIGAQIYQNNQPIAYISYNLRVWAGKVGDMNSVPFEENNSDIEDKIAKLKKVYNSTMIPESIKQKALEEIENLKKQRNVAKPSEPNTSKPKVTSEPVIQDDRIGDKHISEVATYIPHRNIKSIVIEFEGKEITLNGSDIFDGIYVDNKIVGVKTRKKREPKVARTQFEEETFEFAKGGYTRPAYDLKTTGDYEFSTNLDAIYQFRVAGFEREGNDTDSLYLDDLETRAKRDLGTIIIKNNAWKKLANGLTIRATSSTGIKGKLKKIS